MSPSWSSPLATRCALLGLGFLLHQAPTSQAQTLTWDASSADAGLQDGSGAWNLSQAQWSSNGSDLTSWTQLPQPASAIFGTGNGAAGTVTVEELIRVQDLTFQTAGSGTYLLNSLAGAQLHLSSGSVITNHANANLELSLVAESGWTKQGVGTLTLSGNTDNAFDGEVRLEAGQILLSKSAGKQALSGQVLVGAGSSLSWGASDQLHDDTDLVVNGGTIAINNQTETYRSYTQKSGGQTGNSNGVVTITGLMRLEGGSTYTVNSGGIVHVGSADFTGMSGATNTLLLGAVSTSKVTSFNIGAGGLTLSGQLLRLNVTTAANHRGNQLSIQGDLTATGANTFTSEDVTPVTGQGISELYLGSALRKFNIISGTSTISRHLHVTGDVGLEKLGAGTLALSTTQNQNLIKVPLLKVSNGILRLTTNEQIRDTSDVLIAGGKFEGNGRTETFHKLTLQGGEFETALNGNFTVSEIEGFANSKLTLSSGGVLRTTHANLTESTVILGSNYAPTASRFHLAGGTLTMNQQSLTFYRPTLAGAGGNEVLLEGNLTATGISSLSFDQTGSFVAGSVSQLRIEGANRVIHTQDAADTLAIGVVLAGQGTWIKTGSGVVTLSGENANTFNGTTRLSDGTLSLAKNHQVDALGGRLEVLGGTLNVANQNQFHDNLVIDQSGGTINLNNRNETFTDLLRHGGEIRNTSGQIVITGTLKGVQGTSNNSGAGSAIYTLNSGGLTTAHTVDFSESTKRFAILMGGNSSVLTRFVVGVGGLKLKDNDLTLNRDNAGSELELQGNLTATGSNAFTAGNLGAAGSRLAQIQHGNSTRVWDIVSGQTTSALPIVSTGGGLTKSGGGTLQLNANNTYSGKTTVRGGVLRLGAAGNLTQTSWIELGSGTQLNVTALTQGFLLNQSPQAMLSGSGTVVGNLTLGQGASLRPGMSLQSESTSSAGALAGKLLIQGHLNASQSSANTVASFNLSSSALGDQLSIDGNLTLNQHAHLLVTFDLGFSSYQVGDSWTLIDWTGTLQSQGFQQGDLQRSGDNSSLNEGNLDLPTLGSGWYWQVSDMNLGQALQITIVPEPSHACLSLMGLAMWALARRRQDS